MNQLQILVLKSLHKAYEKIFVSKNNAILFNPDDANQAADEIMQRLKTDDPLMIARFGGFELAAVYNHVGITSKKRSALKYIEGKEPPWWSNKGLLDSLHNNAGVFPNKKDIVERFCALMLEDMPSVDILGSWLSEELYFHDRLKAKKVHLFLLEPFWSETPWTSLQKNNMVLVVHPFKKTIERQYEKRDLLFEKKGILPTFASLDVIRAVQSHDKSSHNYSDWFEALQAMKNQIDAIDYDICLIGAGAYGFPLAAHVKRQGKKAVHLGGALQLLFGIRGKRWENPEYGVNAGVPYGFYKEMMNEYWVRPDETETPTHAAAVEGACYW